MSDFITEIEQILNQQKKVPLVIKSMGTFEAWLHGNLISPKAWGRDKTVQLFQFMITARHRRALHKEQIIDRLWEESDGEGGDRNFKVALHGINKTLEPDRKSRTEAKFIIRQGLTYQLNLDEMWIDAEAIEKLIMIGNAALLEDPKIAGRAYEEAISLHHGVYLPNRMYEDWSSEERERLQLLILGAYITLADLVLTDNPDETIRLCQQALILDHSWEEAYRLQMIAYIQKGNRPQAIKTFEKCKSVLDDEYGIEPLPQTSKVMQDILEMG